MQQRTFLGVLAILILLCLIKSGNAQDDPEVSDWSPPSTLTKADLAEPLSPEAARTVVQHLTQLLQLVRCGGPPPGDSDDKTAGWTLDSELRSWKETPTDVAKEIYLDQYRTAFLDQWTRITNECIRTKEGGIFIPSGPPVFSTCCFQQAGTTRGNYAAQTLALYLFCPSIKKGDGKPSGKNEPNCVPAAEIFSNDLQPSAQELAIAFLYLYAAGDGDLLTPGELLDERISDPDVATAHYLSRVVQFLRNGTRNRGFDEPNEKWSLEEEFAKWKLEPTDANRQRYLSDYRRTFLPVWVDKLRETVVGHESCCFQPAGTTNGHYAAQDLADNLRAMLDDPFLFEVPKLDGMDAGHAFGGGLAETARREKALRRVHYTPAATIRVLRYLHVSFPQDAEVSPRPMESTATHAANEETPRKP